MLACELTRLFCLNSFESLQGLFKTDVIIIYILEVRKQKYTERLKNLRKITQQS